MDTMNRIALALNAALLSMEGPGCPPRLAAAMRHAVVPGGARIRPQLCVAVAQAHGDDAPRLVDAAGDSMGEIVSQVQRVSQMISALSGSAGDQAAGIGQVGHAVAQLDQVTQQNSALVEESAAAAASLRQQAASLAELVSVFKIGGAQTNSRAFA